jgi:hypothetical protein
MRRLSKRTLIVLAGIFFLIQFIPLDRTNPPVETSVDAPVEVIAVLERACYDCHSNETVWPAYSRIAPISWLVVHDVHDGREAVNYSTWNLYSAEEQAELREETWEELEEGEMPLPLYPILHSNARLSDADRAVVRAWAGASEENDDETEH